MTDKSPLPVSIAVLGVLFVLMAAGCRTVDSITDAAAVSAEAGPVYSEKDVVPAVVPFDPEDSTENLQAAFDSGVPVILVPFTGSPWIVEPLDVRDDTTIILEPGVVILAREGAFLGRGDSLLRIHGVENVTVVGYGAEIRMRKDDYRRPPYEKSQWRHAISIRSSRSVTVEGLTVRSGGGDGVYVSNLRGNDHPTYCSDVVLRDLLLDDNYRQGISVISVERLLVENVEAINTSGFLPMAGIDFEPNRPDERLVDIVVRDSRFAGNHGAGINVVLRRFDSDSIPVSILIDSCTVERNFMSTLFFKLQGDPRGRIEFRDTPLSFPRRIFHRGDLEVVFSTSSRNSSM